MFNQGDDPWFHGYEAFEEGKGLGDNPYDPNEDEHLSWNDGYSTAEQEYYDADN